MMDTIGTDMEAGPVEEVGELLRGTGAWSEGKCAVVAADGPLQVCTRAAQHARLWHCSLPEASRPCKPGAMCM
jgi:hypothetical protein